MIEVENVFQGIFSVMYLVGEGDQEGQNVKSIVKALSGNSSHATKRRLNMLVTLFNLCNEVTSKLEVLTGKHIVSRPMVVHKDLLKL